MSVAAVNAGGGVSVSSVHVSRDNAFGSPLIESISATFPIALEVVQDNVFGSAPRLSERAQATCLVSLNAIDQLHLV